MIVDLFCGAGGWSVAAKSLGLPVVGYDNNTDALATYAAAGFTGIHADLSTYRPVGCVGILASPPCQPYSVAGLKQGRVDSRAMLPLVLATWAEHAAPRWIAVEQVEGASSVINRLAAMLVNLGYKVVLREVNAETFGVPQTRKRIVLMAHRTTKPGRPVPTHSRYDPRHPTRLQDGLLPWVSMADALRWEEADVVGFPRVDDQGGDGYRERDLRVAAQPAFALTSKVRSWTRHRPSPTIVGSFRPEVVAAPGYRTQVSRQDMPGSVEVTVAEAGILQGFAPDYPWQGSPTSAYRQVGNAFPPPVAAAVIKELL
jgi:DNA (cytosine-5)-methyltransferase 1